MSRSGAKLILFFTVGPRLLNLAVEPADNMQRRGKVVKNVLVRCCQQEADSPPSSGPPNVVGDDFGQRAIKRGGELVGQNPLRVLRKRLRETKTVTLPVAQLLWGAQQQLGFTQPADREQRHRFLNRQPQRIDEDILAQIE